MSEEQLKAFIAKVQADTSLQEQLKAEGADVVAIAQSAGFAITTEDLNTQRQTLSDDELEGMAGGRVAAALTENCATAPRPQGGWRRC
ncbi:Nif11-like leader peptide family natural product precursor [Prochlorococcus sp. MIT 1227]|uniref:Nif11-like leader peptide family natural product precursor n=1 Tax=Prochlorococcus sp. MIT 1227 TaxID=3082536 RepID=UPI0039A62D15